MYITVKLIALFIKGYFAVMYCRIYCMVVSYSYYVLKSLHFTVQYSILPNSLYCTEVYSIWLEGEKLIQWPMRSHSKLLIYSFNFVNATGFHGHGMIGTL